MKNWFKGSLAAALIAGCGLVGTDAGAVTATVNADQLLAADGGNSPRIGNIGTRATFTFNFVSLNFSAITSIVLNLISYSRTNDNSPNEAWKWTADGGEAANLSLTTTGLVTQNLGLNSTSIASANTNKFLNVKFADGIPAGGDKFHLGSLSMTVTYASAVISTVPVPAGGLLLLTGLGGLAAAFRRKV